MANECIPLQFRFLENEPEPKLLVEALKMVTAKRIMEINKFPELIDLVEEAGLGVEYNPFEMTWNGAGLAIAAKRAGLVLPFSGYDILRPLKWSEFGVPVLAAKLGDIMVFARKDGGRVGIYCGETMFAYLILNGSQSTVMGFTWIMKDRCVAITRPIYPDGLPTRIRRIAFTPNGMNPSTLE